jgi:hypothetical protein
MYGLKPVPFKDGILLFLELLPAEFAVISVHQRGMEIAVNGVCGQFRKKRIVGHPRISQANVQYFSRVQLELAQARCVPAWREAA